MPPKPTNGRTPQPELAAWIRQKRRSVPPVRRGGRGHPHARCTETRRIGGLLYISGRGRGRSGGLGARHGLAVGQLEHVVLLAGVLPVLELDDPELLELG